MRFLLQFGESQRSYGATNMNEHSSRSHVLFRMTVKRGFTSSQLTGASALNPLAGLGADGIVVDETGPDWEMVRQLHWGGVRKGEKRSLRSKGLSS